jgi:hypothetical protein
MTYCEDREFLLLTDDGGLFVDLALGPPTRILMGHNIAKYLYISEAVPNFKQVSVDHGSAGHRFDWDFVLPRLRRWAVSANSRSGSSRCL